MITVTPAAIREDLRNRFPKLLQTYRQPFRETAAEKTPGTASLNGFRHLQLACVLPCSQKPLRQSRQWG